MDFTTYFLEENNWVIKVFIVIFLTLLSSFFINVVLKRLKVKLEKTKNIWDDSFVISIRKPLKFLIWTMGLTVALEITSDDPTLVKALYPLRDVLFISLLAWFLLKFIQEVEVNIKKRKKVDISTVDAITKILKVTVIITSGLVILQTLGFSIGGVLAFGGVGGVAVGFAAKDMLANFFGALMIYLDRPFKIGDWVRSPDRQIEGTVTKIGWRLTEIQTFDRRPLYVPNSVFSTILLENPSRMKNRRIYENIGVRYSDAKNLPKIVESIKTMLEKNEDIDNSQTLIVNVNKFQESSIEMMIYCFTKTTNWIEFHNIKQNLMLEFEKIIVSNNSEIAFPTTTIDLPDNLKA